MKLRIKGSLFTCGRCRKAYSNPLGHVCVTRLDRQPGSGKTKLAPSLSAALGTCGTCGKPIGNPLTHTCAVKTDYRRRSADRRRQEAAARRKTRPKHLYQSCREPDCKRVPCIAFREGFEEGYAAAAAAAAEEAGS